MGMAKSDPDVKRQAIANLMNSQLISAGISVVGGGSEGPYQVIVSRLCREEVRKVVDAVLKATGRTND